MGSVSGKINYFKKNYQITNSSYIEKVEGINKIQKIIPKYNLTEGLTEKMYRKIIDQVITDLPDLNEWHDESIIKQFKFDSWKFSIQKMHSSSIKGGTNNKYFKRLVLDEIISNLIILSKNRSIIKTKKSRKIFDNSISDNIFKNLSFELTQDQKKSYMK